MIPKLPKEFDNGFAITTIASRWKAIAEHYKAVAEAQAELLLKYRNYHAHNQYIRADERCDQLQREIEEARKV